MRIRGALLSLTVALVSSWALTGAAAAVDGVGCGSVIDEDMVLTHDLVDCENGLVVGAPNVTLDLGGHRISGRGAGDGVSVQAANAIVRNGSINAFAVGVILNSQASGTAVSNLDIGGNGEAILDIAGASGLRIKGNSIHHNGTGIFLGFAEAAEIVDNRIIGNEAWGIFTYRGGGGIVDANLVMRNGDDGIHLDSSHTVATNNFSSRNGGDGIWVFDEVPCSGHLNFFRLGSNVTDGNQGLGINVVVPTFCPPGSEPVDLLDAGGNAASRNGDPRECTVVECARNRGQASKLAPLSAISPHAQSDDLTTAMTRLREATQR